MSLTIHTNSVTNCITDSTVYCNNAMHCRNTDKPCYNIFGVVFYQRSIDIDREHNTLSMY